MGILKKILGIEALEKRVEILEKSQTDGNTDRKPKKLSQNVLDEWINGKADGK